MYLQIWHLFSLIHSFPGHTAEVTCMMMHPTTPILFSASLDSTIRMWRLDNMELVYILISYTLPYACGA